MKTDDELNALFAEKWLNLKVDREEWGTAQEPAIQLPCNTPGMESWAPLPNFVGSTLVMLKILEESGLCVCIKNHGFGWSVEVYGGLSRVRGSATSEPLSMAIVCALLDLKGVKP